MHRDIYYLFYLYGDHLLLLLTCLFHIWKEIASKVKINNFVIYGYIFYTYVRNLYLMAG